MFKKLLARISNKTKIAFILMLLTVFNLNDLIPDYILGVGQVDDLAVIIFFIKSLYNDIKVTKRERKIIEE